MRQRYLFLMTILLTAVLNGPGCGSKGTLNFEIVVPDEGASPFVGVTTITIRAGEKEKSATISNPDDPIDLSVDLAPGTQTTLELEGTDDSGKVLCSGSSPTFNAVDYSQALRIWVSKLGASSQHPAHLTKPAMSLAIATYGTTNWSTFEEQPLYTFWMDGCTAAGLPLDEVGYFDPYLQEVADIPNLADDTAWTDSSRAVQPRCSSSAMSIADGNLLLFGGTNADGNPTDELDLLLPKDNGYQYWPIALQCDDGIDNDGDGTTDLDDDDCTGARDASEGPNADWSVSGAKAVALGPYASLWDGSSNQVVNSFLVIGGWSATGRSPMALHLVAERGANGTNWNFTVLDVGLLSARAGHVAISSTKLTDSIELHSVLVFGGTSDATDQVPAESFQFDLDESAPSLDWTWKHEPITEDDQGTLPNLTASAGTHLPGAAILVAGGRDSALTPTANGWIFDPTKNQLTKIPDLLGDARSGHTMTLVGNLIVVAGGTLADGSLAPDAVILRYDSASTPPVSVVAQVPMVTPRSGHAAFVTATGQIAVAGGTDKDGNLLDSIEVFNLNEKAYQ